MSDERDVCRCGHTEAVHRMGPDMCLGADLADLTADCGCSRFRVDPEPWTRSYTNQALGTLEEAAGWT